MNDSERAIRVTWRGIGYDLALKACVKFLHDKGYEEASVLLRDIIAAYPDLDQLIRDIGP